MRLRPDRIVVGEVRGGEALDLLVALNTGHDGCLSTCHANSAEDALHRLEALALQADGSLPHDVLRLHVHAAVDAVVHVARLPDGRRVVQEVREVRPAKGGRVPRSRTRLLTDGRTVLALPRRPARTPEAPPPPTPGTGWADPRAPSHAPAQGRIVARRPRDGTGRTSGAPRVVEAGMAHWRVA
jgi:hypothetical protein